MQLEFFDVPSPCIGICQSNDKGQCLGCFRTRVERQGWISFDSDERQKVIKRCTQRKNRQVKKASESVTDQLNDNLNNKSDGENNVIVQPSLLDPPSKKTLDTSSNLDFDDFEL